MKRIRFDPGFERRKLGRRYDALLAVREKAQQFCRSVQDALDSSDVEPGAFQSCEPLCRDLVLVAALGGLEGVECLKVACGLVPEEFVAERSSYME